MLLKKITNIGEYKKEIIEIAMSLFLKLKKPLINSRKEITVNNQIKFLEIK